MRAHREKGEDSIVAVPHPKNRHLVPMLEAEGIPVTFSVGVALCELRIGRQGEVLPLPTPLRPLNKLGDQVIHVPQQLSLWRLTTWDSTIS